MHDAVKNVRVRVYVTPTDDQSDGRIRAVFPPTSNACAPTFACSTKQIQTDGVVTSRGESCPALFGKGRLRLASRRKRHKYVFGFAELSFSYCVRLTMAAKSRATVKVSV